MAARRWTHEELRKLAQGRYLTARNPQAADVTPPVWLVQAADGRWPWNSSSSLELVHPDDRLGLVNAFFTSVATPGKLVTVQVRSRSHGYWHHSESIWLNLVDQDDVGVILSFIQEVDGPPIVAPVEDAGGDHTVSRWMVWTMSDAGMILSAEGASLDLLGYETDELTGRPPTDFLPPDSVADSIGLWVELHEHPGSTATSRRPWMRRDGTQIWLEASYLHRPDDHDDDDEQVVLVVIWDITERMAQEQALRDREAELQQREAEKSALAAQMSALADDFRLLADEVPAAVFRCNPSGLVIFHNVRWKELLDGEDHVKRLHDLVAPHHHDSLDHALAELARADTVQRRSLEVDSRDGERVWQVNLRGMGKGGGRSLVGSIEDVSATVRLRREARYDALTGLLNRHALIEQITDVLSTDPEDAVILFVDLDDFKDVNDTFGHDAGDVVLAEVGRRLGAGLRPDDAVGRYGGDEFVVVCRDTATLSEAAISHRLTIALGGPITFPGGSWQPNASIGAARPEPGDDLAAVLRRADLEMFEIKRLRTTRSQLGRSGR